jgi:hypothetical protein
MGELESSKGKIYYQPKKLWFWYFEFLQENTVQYVKVEQQSGVTNNDFFSGLKKQKENN